MIRLSTFSRQAAIVIGLGLVPAGPALLAQERAGSLTGRVADSSNNALPGAAVQVEPRSITVITDHDGLFTISNLAPGTYKVSISYIGFNPDTREVGVDPGSQSRMDAKLRPAVSTSEEVTVTASRSRGEVEALNQQKTSENILNVLPEEVITSLPNANVADAIGRLPSVSLERDEGEGKYVQIRGLEPRLSNFTINGAHIPSTESSVRNAKLDAIPSDLVGSIELYKTLSPDQEGDAIGGTVNLVTRTAGDQPYFNIGGQGGRTDTEGGAYLYQFDGTASARFGEDKKLGLVIGGSYDWNGRGINDVEPSPTTADFPGAPGTPVLPTLDIREYKYYRSRLGFAGGLDYRLGGASGLYVRGLYTDFKNYGDRWVATPAVGNFVTPTVADNTGSFARAVSNRRPEEKIYSISVGGKHDLRTVLIDYNLSYSHAGQHVVNALEADYATIQSNIAYNVNTSDPFFPQLTATNGVNVNDPTLYALNQYLISNEVTDDRDVAGLVNVSIPYGAGSGNGVLKFGGKIRSGRKTNNLTDHVFGTTGNPLLLSQALDNFTDPNFYLGRYGLGPLPSLGGSTSLFNSNPSSFVEDPNQFHANNDPNAYTAEEKVYAGYAMTTNKLGRLHVQLGLRVEATHADYTGNIVVFDANANWVSTTPTSGAQDYTNVLPNVQFRYEVDPETNIRAVYGRGISRPNFSDLPPFLQRQDANLQISIGNPKLRPTSSNNYDVLLEHYLSSVGVVAIGGFYKDLHDPIYAAVSTLLTSGPFAGYTQFQAQNGAKAKVYGVEVAWQQHLSFLPGALNGLGVLANYTHTDSQAVVFGRSDNPRLQRTTPNEANFGITYDKGGFSARAALTYNDANIFAYNFLDGAPGGTKGPNGDNFLYPHTQIDAQVSYTFKTGLVVVAEGLNLNNEVFGHYLGSPQFMLQREFYGPSVIFGLRYRR
jgi:TonB-dependent receptor